MSRDHRKHEDSPTEGVALPTYALLEFDEDTGAATKIVGFLSVNNNRMAVEFNVADSNGTWPARLIDLAHVQQTNNPSFAAVYEMMDGLNGMTAGAVRVDDAPSGSPDDIVATLTDDAIAAAGQT